jgi:hypothetical protein
MGYEVKETEHAGVLRKKSVWRKTPDADRALSLRTMS